MLPHSKAKASVVGRVAAEGQGKTVFGPGGASAMLLRMVTPPGTRAVHSSPGTRRWPRQVKGRRRGAVCVCVCVLLVCMCLLCCVLGVCVCVLSRVLCSGAFVTRNMVKNMVKNKESNKHEARNRRKQRRAVHSAVLLTRNQNRFFDSVCRPQHP